MLQLSAGRGRRPEHGARLCDGQLGHRLRRYGDDAGLVHSAADSLATGNGAGDRRPGLGRRQRGRRLAAQHSAPSARSAQGARTGRRCGHRAGVHRVRPAVSPGMGQRVSRADPGQRLQHRLRDIGILADGAVAARHPVGYGRCGSAIRGGQRRMQHGPAGDRVSLRRGAGHLRQPCDLQERRQGNRRPARQEPNVHGEIR
ncbi:Uncharacterised protein [Mycobacterium tuberculosis]|uniref:Uncharacterized protein n=1 Tax=Mycobacterium tuberculosis TaxID=1773 RepID=A0A654TXR7_MYCTX|nr:Uncharacterised protein [Mycobacterium tuberculosis]CKN71233.1 Uncharacterised protein [Mycobacterium tuberculosis]CKS39429.1 Uncharacterised protein [Mycobacterium tuberculosis]